MKKITLTMIKYYIRKSSIVAIVIAHAELISWPRQSAIIPLSLLKIKYI